MREEQVRSSNLCAIAQATLRKKKFGIQELTIVREKAPENHVSVELIAMSDHETSSPVMKANQGDGLRLTETLWPELRQGQIQLLSESKGQNHNQFLGQ